MGQCAARGKLKIFAGVLMAGGSLPQSSTGYFVFPLVALTQ